MATTVLAYAAFALFPIGMAYAAASDLLTMTISNRISLLLLGGFLALAPLTGMSLPEFGMHWAVAGIVLAIGFFCFAMRWMGGGDVKLAAIAALWLGPVAGINFVGLSAIFGGALTLLMLSFRNAAPPAVIFRVPFVARLHSPDEGVPYGIALAAAALIIYPTTSWISILVS